MRRKSKEKPCLFIPLISEGISNSKVFLMFMNCWLNVNDRRYQKLRCVKERLYIWNETAARPREIILYIALQADGIVSMNI